jgi:carboxymethylenebutenolidase
MRRFLKIAFFVVAGIVAASLAVFAGALAWDVAFSGRTAAQFTNTDFPGADGITLHSYVAAPAGEGPHPAILLIHEWWGLNEDTVAKADELAANGYVVMAVDAWRGVSTRSMPRAILQVTTTSQDRVSSDLDSAFQYLANMPSVDRNRIAAMGFCYGGGQSLLFGMRQPVAATILFYGNLVNDPAELALLKGKPVLGIFGAEDAVISTESVRSFEQSLKDMMIESQITIYPGVGHAFANQADAIKQPGAAFEAWQETLSFLEAHLKNSNRPG